MQGMQIRFDNRTVLITGAATGIGKATAKAFAAAGAAVVIGDVDPRADGTASEIVAAGGRAVFQKTDVTDSGQVQALVARAVSEFGSLDVAFNNAGLLPPTAPLAEQTEADWHRIIAVDVTGVFLCLKHELAHMAKVGRGAIVNTASAAGEHGGAAGVVYTMSKHACVGLTRNTAWYYAKKGIRCNAMIVGGVNTNIMASVDPSKINAAGAQQAGIYGGIIPNFLQPMDVANLALFLASDESSMVNGANIAVDGGWGAA